MQWVACHNESRGKKRWSRTRRRAAGDCTTVCCAKREAASNVVVFFTLSLPFFLFFMNAGLEPLRPLATLRSNTKAPLSSCQAGARVRPVIFQSALAPAAPPCVRSALPPSSPTPPIPLLSNQHVPDIFPHCFHLFSPLPLPPAAIAHRNEHSPEGNLLLSARGESSACSSSLLSVRPYIASISHV